MRREWNSPLNELFWSIVETPLSSSLESLAKDWWWQRGRQIWANRSQILRWFQIYTKPNTAKWGPNAALISYKWDHRSSLLSLMTNLYTDLLGGKDLTQSEKIKIYSKDWKVRFLLTSHFTGLGLLQTDLFSVFSKKAEEAYRWDIRWLTHIDIIQHVDQPLSFNLDKSTFEFHQLNNKTISVFMSMQLHGKDVLGPYHEYCNDDMGSLSHGICQLKNLWQDNSISLPIERVSQ